MILAQPKPQPESAEPRRQPAKLQQPRKQQRELESESLPAKQPPAKRKNRILHSLSNAKIKEKEKYTEEFDFAAANKEFEEIRDKLDRELKISLGVNKDGNDSGKARRL